MNVELGGFSGKYISILYGNMGMGMGCEPILVQDVCHKAKSMYKHL